MVLSLSFCTSLLIFLVSTISLFLLEGLLFNNNSNSNSSLISPTAHYTGYTWVRNGLSDNRLATDKGYYLFYSLEPFMILGRWFKAATLEDMLLTRHQLLDKKLEDAIESGRVTQIIEVAAGLSPRGLRFAKKYGDRIKYIEADLPAMVKLKKSLISFDLSNRHHLMVDVNALQTDDAATDSLLSVARNNGFSLDEGTAIITEGLVNYFSQDNLILMWSKFAATLSLFPTGMYISDIHLSGHSTDFKAKAFKLMLSMFVRRSVHNHFKTTDEVVQSLRSVGFAQMAVVHDPVEWADTLEYCRTPGARRVSIIDARISLDR